jgi:hypothetical protein
MSNRILFLLIVLNLFPFVGTEVFAQSDEGDKVGKDLIAALEAYNKNAASSKSVEGPVFFGKRNMLTKSLAAALQHRCDLDSDPFLQAQDTVPGFVLKGVKMGEGVARVQVAHKPNEYVKGDEFVTFIMLKEDGAWKIDDIDWESGTLKQACR